MKHITAVQSTVHAACSMARRHACNRALSLTVWAAVCLLVAVKPLHTGGVSTRAATSPRRPQTGFNAVDLWWRYQDGRRVSARESMLQAADAGYSYLRVAGTGFWPSNMRGYVRNSSAYWSLFDEFVDDAAAAHVQLVISIQWNMFLFADMVRCAASIVYSATHTKFVVLACPPGVWVLVAVVAAMRPRTLRGS